MKALLSLLLLLAMPVAVRAGEEALRLDVKGEIAIDKGGAVYDYKIETILTPEIKELVDRSVRKWKFEPVIRNGAPAYAKSDMYLTLLASRVEAGYQLRVERVRFGGSRKERRMQPPRYPTEALRAGLPATVLVAVRIDEEGNVMDAVAAQSSLDGVKATKKAAENWLKSFDKVAVAAARKWKFEAADVASGDAPETTQLVPVEFRIDSPESEEGWRYASAGISHPIPWLPAEKQTYDATGLRHGESIALDGAISLKQDVVGTAL